MPIIHRRVKYGLGVNNGKFLECEYVETKGTCQFLGIRGLSSIRFKLFDIPENIQVLFASVKIHCRQTVGGSINLFLNGNMFMSEYSSAPEKLFGAQQFLIPSACLQRGENWFKIALDTNSEGAYWISNIEVDYSYIQATYGKQNNIAILKVFRFDFSGEVSGVTFEKVAITDLYRNHIPYRLFLCPGSSSGAIKFHIKDCNASIGWLKVILYHCRTNADAIINIYVNLAPLLLNHSPIPWNDFGFEQFIIPRKLIVTGQNTVNIQLSKDSPGVYWLSSAIIQVVCLTEEEVRRSQRGDQFKSGNGKYYNFFVCTANSRSVLVALVGLGSSVG